MFADTSGWASAADRRQSFHNLSGTLIRQAHRAGKKFVTTNYVLAELASLLTSPLRIPRPCRSNTWPTFGASTCIEIVHVDVSLDVVAWQLWQIASRQGMELRGLRLLRRHATARSHQALTTDHHFEQAGFVRLLK